MFLQAASSAAVGVVIAGSRQAIGSPSGATGTAEPGLESFDELMASFLEKHHVPGAALAVTKDSRLVYARGFGWANREREVVVQPNSLFRIASISKPITAAAILQLVEREKLGLDSKIHNLLKLAEPADARWKQVTIEQLLEHTGGWDRSRSFDPMFRSRGIATALDVKLPIRAEHVIRYMLDQPLTFDPGTQYAYSNFGYCLLGRAIERVAGAGYEQYVQTGLLEPLGIKRMRLGKTPMSQRAAEETTYYDSRQREGPAVTGTIGETVAAPYGIWPLEIMDSHGGWVASAVDLVRFAAAFDQPGDYSILNAKSIAAMFARHQGPAGYGSDGKEKAAYYGYGWQGRGAGAGRLNAWHTGSLDGTSSLLVRRHDGLNWAALFNADRGLEGRSLAGQIDPLIHQAAGKVRQWPNVDRFGEFL
jgi:N-acyl-D-amino-acid deacylase